MRFHAKSRLLPAMALILGTAATAGAVNLLSVTPSSAALSCNTATGVGAVASIVVKASPALTGSNSLTVSLGALPAGVVAVTTPASQILNLANNTAGLTYTFNLAPGCANVTAGAKTLQFNTGAGADVTATLNVTLTATTSALVPSPAAATVTCVKVGPDYTPSPAKTISVSSAVSAGTPFTVDTTNLAAGGLTVTNSGGGLAKSTPVTFTVKAAAGCGGFDIGSSTVTNVHLVNAPAPAKDVPVTLQVLAQTPLVAAPTTAKLTYTKGSGTPGYADVLLSSAASPAPFYTVDTTSLPIWLTVDAVTGRTSRMVRFSSTSVADTLAPGTYNSTVYVKVSGYGDLAIPVTILVTNPAPKLTVAEGLTRNLSWTIGNPSPTPVITAVSSDSPISYTATSGGSLAPVIAARQLSGLAYSFGTQIGISFDPTILASAAPGSALSGTVTLSWGVPVQTTVVTFNITVLSPGATISAVTPASLPTAAAGQTFTVVLSGTGFIPSADLTLRTRVGIVVGGVIVANSNIVWNVVNASNIILSITVPATADTYLPFSPSGAGGNVNLGICNPWGTPCTTPTGTATLSIGAGPIVQVVTSASSFVQVNPGSTPTVAPYDLVSIFGTNFCSSSGTGCSSSQILYGTPDTAFAYPTALSPDAVSGTQRLLSVKFQTQAATPVVLATANLLFATNGQINLVVPSALSAQIGNTVDIVVSFGYGTGATMLSSRTFPVTIAATNPGVFTVGSDGQGQGAALDAVDYSLVGAANEAGMRSTPADSDTIMLYVTGLGAPDSTADNASTGGSAWSADCITPASYLTSLNALTGGSLTTVDGLIIQGGLLNTGRISPCIVTTSPDKPAVTIGGVAGTVGYAGWVAGSIAGLYQINVKLPGRSAGPFVDAAGNAVGAITAPVQLPVVVTANGVPSQAGVTMWVAPRLKVVAPSTLTGTVGTAWASSNNAVVATEGTAPYRYAVTSGVLPQGLLLNAATGAITGIPAANTSGSYSVTVTATDAANVPIRDSVQFTLTIAGGLVVNMTGTSPYSGTFGTANATLTTASATGGTYPYTYAITAPGTLPTGMTINATTGVIGITAFTPAGTYHVTVTATDYTPGTPLTGSASFDIVVGLLVAKTAPTATTNGVANATITTVSATGNTGTVTYALDAATAAAYSWLSINASTGVVSATSAVTAGSKTITITATDGTAAPSAASPGTGTITFTLVVG